MCGVSTTSLFGFRTRPLSLKNGFHRLPVGHCRLCLSNLSIVTHRLIVALALVVNCVCDVHFGTVIQILSFYFSYQSVWSKLFFSVCLFCCFQSLCNFNSFNQFVWNWFVKAETGRTFPCLYFDIYSSWKFICPERCCKPIYDF